MRTKREAMMKDQ